MNPENEKYKKVLNLLRNSKPELYLTEDFEIEVIKKIKKDDRRGFNLPDAIDFLFGWVYIGWVRRALVTTSVILVLIFVLQQGIILRRIDMLSRQTVIIDKEKSSTTTNEIDKLLMDYKNSGRRFPSKTVTISEKEMQELLESVNELKIKYKDLENIIDSDPELKKVIEKKLNEYNRLKINL